jgi:hypothetical protein
MVSKASLPANKLNHLPLAYKERENRGLEWKAWHWALSSSYSLSEWASEGKHKGGTETGHSRCHPRADRSNAHTGDLCKSIPVLFSQRKKIPPEQTVMNKIVYRQEMWRQGKDLCALMSLKGSAFYPGQAFSSSDITVGFFKHLPNAMCRHFSYWGTEAL